MGFTFRRKIGKAGNISYSSRGLRVSGTVKMGGISFNVGKYLSGAWDGKTTSRVTANMGNGIQYRKDSTLSNKPKQTVNKPTVKKSLGDDITARMDLINSGYTTEQTEFIKSNVKEKKPSKLLWLIDNIPAEIFYLLYFLSIAILSYYYFDIMGIISSMVGKQTPKLFGIMAFISMLPFIFVVFAIGALIQTDENYRDLDFATRLCTGLAATVNMFMTSVLIYNAFK